MLITNECASWKCVACKRLILKINMLYSIYDNNKKIGNIHLKFY